MPPPWAVEAGPAGAFSSGSGIEMVTWAAVCAASTSARVPVSPMTGALKYFSHDRTAAAESRSGSVVTKTTVTFSRVDVGSLRSATAMSAMAVGHWYGQFV